MGRNEDLKLQVAWRKRGKDKEVRQVNTLWVPCNASGNKHGTHPVTVVTNPAGVIKGLSCGCPDGLHVDGAETLGATSCCLVVRAARKALQDGRYIDGLRAVRSAVDGLHGPPRDIRQARLTARDGSESYGWRTPFATRNARLEFRYAMAARAACNDQIKWVSRLTPGTLYQTPDIDLMLGSEVMIRKPAHGKWRVADEVRGLHVGMASWWSGGECIPCDERVKNAEAHERTEKHANSIRQLLRLVVTVLNRGPLSVLTDGGKQQLQKLLCPIGPGKLPADIKPETTCTAA